MGLPPDRGWSPNGCGQKSIAREGVTRCSSHMGGPTTMMRGGPGTAPMEHRVHGAPAMTSKGQPAWHALLRLEETDIFPIGKIDAGFNAARRSKICSRTSLIRSPGPPARRRWAARTAAVCSADNKPTPSAWVKSMRPSICSGGKLSGDASRAAYAAPFQGVCSGPGATNQDVQASTVLPPAAQGPRSAVKEWPAAASGATGGTQTE